MFRSDSTVAAFAVADQPHHRLEGPVRCQAPDRAHCLVLGHVLEVGEGAEAEQRDFQIASSTIALLIFEPPTSRSGERIGIRPRGSLRAAPDRSSRSEPRLSDEIVEVDRLEHGAPVALEAAGQDPDARWRST